jgi:iron complex transport system permease protein
MLPTVTPARRLATGLAILLPLLALAVAAALLSGAESIRLSDLARGDEVARTIVGSLRAPRVVLAALVGAVLALAGLTFQSLLRNPLADPFILGVSGGAAAGASLASALGLAGLPGVVPLLAFSGATAATGAVLGLSRRRGGIDASRLILAGLVLNAFCSAIILLALSVTQAGDLQAALRWMMGSLSGATWSDVAIVGAAAAIASLLLAWSGRDMRLLLFGDDDARARGVDPERLKLYGFAIAAVVTGLAVSVSGIIGFVGLLVPHALRMLFGADFRVLLPLSIPAGALLLVLADAMSRGAAAPAELPIGALTALVGVPFFLVLLARSDR